MLQRTDPGHQKCQGLACRVPSSDYPHHFSPEQGPWLGFVFSLGGSFAATWQHHHSARICLAERFFPYRGSHHSIHPLSTTLPLIVVDFQLHSRLSLGKNAHHPGCGDRNSTSLRLVGFQPLTKET